VHLAAGSASAEAPAFVEGAAAGPTGELAAGTGSALGSSLRLAPQLGQAIHAASSTIARQEGQRRGANGSAVPQ
jgi:hypothetical protein